MTAPPTGPLLIDAPMGRHFAQLHRDTETLAETVHVFLEAGLRRGNSVVAIAIPPHIELLRARLTASRLHSAALQQSGQLELLNAERLLGAFMRNGMPDWPDFRAALGAVLERVHHFGRGTRVYCELPNLLWHDGLPQAAIRLEDFWNALARLHPFSLYCGYLLDPQREESYAGPLEEIGRTHTDVLATPEDQRFGAALDAAGRELFGIALSQMAGFGAPHEGAQRFPSGQRTMLWVRRNLPSSSSAVLERARRYFDQQGEGHRY
ncbi:MAG: MEDS domain-containing protein [Gemmatimonadales bacterium]